MTQAKQFLKLSGGQNECEVGPFDSVSVGGSLFVGESTTPAATFDHEGGYWQIVDGAQLGDERLNGNEYGIILGQAKLVE